MKEDLSSELVSALLGLFAHDLRNPLSALHSNVSFLGSVVGTSDTEANEALEDVAASSDALGHITDNLELFALALDGAKLREPHEFQLREVLRESAQKSRRFAESYRVNLHVDADSAAELRALANRDMLMRSLCNLIRNSIQHAGESGKVGVRAARDGAQLVVVVSDSGVALAPEVGEQAFTAEGQLSTKNVSGGRYSRGLGLYAARIAAGIAGATVQRSGAPDGRFELRVNAR
ncbi:MAG TPA: HAMP domain-containing sensor histidine kinase [Polyangiaceae bacterium]|nr:HAMP domain-containing sensor histidine kinase [Polyangiaceae bacterium]